jgi:hypothetical protein
MLTVLRMNLLQQRVSLLVKRLFKHYENDSPVNIVVGRRHACETNCVKFVNDVRRFLS